MRTELHPDCSRDSQPGDLEHCLAIADTALQTTMLVQIDASPTSTPPATLESEARYRRLIRAMPVVVFELAADGMILQINPAITAVTGYTPGELRGTNWWQTFLPAAGPSSADLRASLQAGDWTRQATVLRARDGSAVILEITTANRYRPDHTLERIVGIGVDITALAQARATLRESQQQIQQLAAIVAAADDAVLCTRLDGTITSWNAAAARLYGYSAAEVEGRSLALLLPPDSPDELPRLLRQIGRAESVRQSETIHVRKNGSRVPVSISASPILDADGSIIGMAKISRSVTEHKRLEEQCRQAQKMEAVGRLAGGVAHDFNNLLTVIMGFSEILMQDLPAEDPIARGLNEIRKAGDRAAALTRQLLAFSRQQVLAPKVLDLNTIVAEMHRMLVRLIGEDIDLSTDLQPSLWQVKADPGQLEQVIMNLAVNARDAMPQGGRLHLATHNVELAEPFVREHPAAREGSFVMLSLRDTGSGISPEVQAHLFEPFFTTKEPGKGTGLGLPTVYGIVQQSGGFLTVQSCLGAGTTFRLYLPRVEDTIVQASAGKNILLAPRGSETLLLAEDDEGLRVLLRDALCEQGYQVLEARNGSEALRLCEHYRGSIDLVISDVVMPQMSGHELAQQLSRLRPQLKVVYMSGYTDDTIGRHGVQSEKVHFLQKPFTPAVLARKIREVLELP